MCLCLSKALQLGFFLWEFKIIKLKSIKKKERTIKETSLPGYWGWPNPATSYLSFWHLISGYAACFPVICLRGCVLVAQSRLTLCNPMDCSLPGSSVHGILQARTLEWAAISFSRGSSWPRVQIRSTVLQADFSLASNINHKCGVLINHNLWRIMVRLDLGKVSQEEGGDEGGAEGWPWWLLDLGARDMCSLHLSSHITQSQQCYLKGAPVPALAGWFDIFLRMLMEAVCYLVELVGFAIRCEFSQSGHLLTMWP